MMKGKERKNGEKDRIEGKEKCQEEKEGKWRGGKGGH